MANNNADGTLILDTELDNSGFEKGSAKLLSAIDGLSTRIEKFGAAMEKAFSNPEALLHSASNAVQQASAAVGKGAKEAIQTAGSSVSSYDKELAKLQKQIDQTEKSLENYHKEIDQIHESTDAMLPNAATDEQAATLLEMEEQEIAKVNEKYAEKTAMLEQLKAKYAEVETARNAAANSTETDQVQQTSQAVAAYDKELEKLAKKIETAKNALKGYEEEKAKIEESTDAMLPNAKTDDQARILMEIEEIEIDKLNQKYATQLETLKNLEAEYTRVNEARNQAAQAQAEEADEEEETIQKGSRLSGILVMLTQGLGNASRAALSLGKRVAQITFNAISTGAKKAVSSLKSFQKQANNTNFKANALVKSLTSLKRLLITRIKRMFISSVFNQVREGFQKLAQYDSEFNTHMNSIKNSATQLSGNIAVALGNLISVVEPVITKILNTLSNAVSYLNQFFALLQGKTTYTSAKMGADNYAESANDAAKAQKKWNNELYSFDELNRQNKNDDSDKTDTTKTGIQYEEKEIDLPKGVQDWIKRLKEAWKNGDWYGVGLIIAEGLNKAMQYVDDWINNKFRPWGVKWASRIAQILNGIVDGVNWELLGKTLADGLNALLDIANTFLKEFNFLNLGAGIGRAVNSLVDNIDWKLLAETLKNGFMGLINLAYGFLSTFDGLKLGKNIGQTIKDWFDGVDWNRVGETFALKWNALLHIIEGIVTTPGIWESIGRSIGNFVKSWFSTIDINSLATIVINVLNGVTSMIRSFLDQNPFEGVAQKIYTAINRVVHEVDWAALGKALSDLFMSVLGVFKEVVKNVDWKGVGQAIGNFLGSIDWLGILSNVAEIIWTAFTGVLSGLMSTDGGRMFLALVAAIKGLQLAFTITQGLWTAAVQRWVLTGISPLQSMPQMISQTIPALKTVLGTMAKAVATGALAVFDGLMIAYDVKSFVDAAKTYNNAQKAYNNEIETALNSFANLYKTKGPEVAAEWAKTCYQIDTTGMSLDQAQKALVQQIDHYWDDTPKNMFEGFKQGWNAYFGKNGKGLLGLLSDAFTGAINGIKSLLGIHSPSTVFASIGRDLIAGLLNGIRETWKNITTFFSTAFSNLKTGFTNTWSNIKTAAGNAWGGIKSTISEKWNGIANYVSKGWGNLKTAVGKVEWKSIGSNLVSGIQNGATSVWSKMTGAISKGWSGLRDGLGKFDFKNIGSNMVSSIQSGVNNIWGRFSSTIVQAWANIRTSFGNIQWNNIGHNMVAGLMNGVNGAWSSMANTIVGYANNLISRIKGAFGIHSPSTVFAEIGENLDAGLEKGIADGQKGLLATATQIAGAVTEGMTPDSPEATITMDSIVTGMQAVISGLSEIATTFKTIADTLVAAGGFQMPQIAAGTVVPYKTKVDTSAPDTDDSEVVKGYLMGILTEIQGLARAMQKDGSTQTIVVPVNINGRTVFEAVVDANNSAIKQLGSSPLKMR